MEIIGKAQILWDRFSDYVKEEERHAENREPGWYVKNRLQFSSEIDNIVWSGYSKCGEGRTYPIAKLDNAFISDLRKHQNYLDTLGTDWGLLYADNIICILKSGKFVVGLPSYAVECNKYEDFNHISIETLRSRIGYQSSSALTSQTGISRAQMTDQMQKKRTEIAQKQSEIQKLEEKKQEELKKIKQELEQKYAKQMQSIEEKKNELKRQMEIMEGQLFLLDTEIYSIRCFMGETVDFIPLCSGKYSPKEEPVIFYQKVRYLDEELGKWLAIYDYDGTDNIYFEQALQAREDIRELFAPGAKSVSLVKVAKDTIHYCQNEFIANTLREYEVYHGNTVGILLRDGENLWMGWTDEEKIRLSDGNVFYQPKQQELAMEDTHLKSTVKEEKASRYFIFSILQGVINSGDLIQLPDEVNILEPNPYIIFSTADGWLEDNRFGTFADIVNRTNATLMKGDMILTTIRITRDDSRSYGEKCTRYDAWNNNRGRGDKNRTHDASIWDLSVVPVNCVDIEQDYDIVYRKYRLLVKEEIVKTYKENEIEFTQARTVTTRTDEYIGTEVDHITAHNNMIFGRYSVKGLTPEQFFEFYKKLGYKDSDGREYLTDFSYGYKGSYYLVYDHIELGKTTRKNYVSAKKTDSNFWGDKKDSYANMEIYPDEYLNLTFLNSVYILYAIRNRKIGGWKRGNKTVAYADSIPYLNAALQYIRIREKEEAAMLEQYMELYDDWQVDLSEWRLEHNYHRLTDSRAKKFAKEVGRLKGVN